MPTDPPDPREQARQVAAAIAADAALEMSKPLEGLKQRLASAVDRVDRHISSSTGPTPYPWKQLHALRSDLAEAYLEMTAIARLVGDLAIAVGTAEAATTVIDVNREVEAAANLIAYRGGGEIQLDLGHVAEARGVPGELMLAVVQLVSAASGDGGSPGAAAGVVVQTRPTAPGVHIEVRGRAGAPVELVDAVTAFVTAIAARGGGTFRSSTVEAAVIFEVGLGS